MNQMFSGVSVLVWGMIAAKAKTGMNAVANGEIKSVSQGLSQVGTLIMMIVVASGINIYLSMDQATTSAIAETATQTPHKLMAAHNEGNLAEVAFETFKSYSSLSLIPAMPTMAALPQNAEEFQTFAITNMKNTFDVKSKAANMLEFGQEKMQIKEMPAILAFIFTTIVSLSYFSAFKTYQKAVSKMDNLKKLLKNPNARVASGQKGKDVMTMIKGRKQEVPKKLATENKSAETVTLLKELIDAKKTEKKAPLLEQPAPKVKKTKVAAPKKDNTLEQIKDALAQRQAPKMAPVATYQMPPVGTQIPMMSYPVVQTAPAPVVVPQPEKAADKQEMIKLLLSELAKPDLEQ
jgi:hypothetical protein